jgi:hypothetical protein
LVAVLVASACTRSSGSQATSAKPMDIYAAGPSVADVRQLLGADNWWPAAPTFGVRPLNGASLPFSERFNITQRFLHVGTTEHFIIDYTAWDSASTATTTMTNVKSALGTSAPGSKAGDEALYYGQQAGALFAYLIFVRVAHVVISAEWTRAEAHLGLPALGKIANKLASRLKDALAGKLHASQLSKADLALLPPPGNLVTALGAAKLPIEAIAAFLPGAPPGQLLATFTDVGVKNFIYGDYALDNDFRMEVRTSEFTFSDRQEATTWIDTVAGAGNLDINGVASAYLDAAGQYIWIFTSGVHGALIFCGSAVAGEAASRACEAPINSVVATWRASLASA